jgi:D-psicose/D-tagatose/L-ribulose 3-epimerase
MRPRRSNHKETVTNPLGVHVQVWVKGWSEPECRLAVEKTKELGYNFIEISLYDLASFDAAMTRRALDEFGLDATCSIALKFETDISSDDRTAVERGERYLMDAVRATHDIGANVLVGITYSALGKYTSETTPQGRRNCVDVLRRVGEYARKLGVTVGVEVVNRYETNVLNTAEQALALIDEIGDDRIIVHLDSYHMNIEEGDLARPIYRCGGRLGYVHIGDSHRGYLGSGTIDFEQLFRALADNGYTGPIAFESFSSAVIEKTQAAALAVWRDLWDDGVHLAAHAREFMETQLVAAKAGSSQARRATTSTGC